VPGLPVEQPSRAGATVVREMKERSATTTWPTPAHVLRREAADVRPLEVVHPAVRPEPLVELAVADVHRDDLRGPPLEEAVGEAPVEAPASTQRSPAGSTSKRSSAAWSFSPPRLT
jgi:hypothetical protein